MIGIDNLRHFVAVVDNRGVLRAAEKIFISASSITRSVQQIETELGRPVFDRVGRTLTLNQEGRRFYEKASRLLRDHAALLGDTPEHGLRGHYRIGASHFLCEYLLCDLVAGLVGRFPNATFEVYSHDSNVLLKRLHEGEIDLGISFSPKSSGAIGYQTIHEGQLYLCGSRRHPLAKLRFPELRRKLTDFPAIIHHPADSIERCDNHPMFRKFKIAPRIPIYWDSDYFALGLLQRSAYWSMLPELVIASHRDITRFSHPREWQAPYRVDLLWNLRKAVTDLKEAALNALRPLPFPTVPRAPITPP